MSAMKSDAARERTRHDYQQRILRVLVHLQQHLDEPLRLDALAELAGYSPCHFHRIFTGMVGETVADHVRRVRLERAALALRDPGAAVLRIALDAGYQDHSAFARAFRAHFACTPAAWRRHPRELPPLDDARRHLVDRPSGRTAMDIRILVLEPLRVAYVRRLGPYQDCGPAWQTLTAWAGRRGLLDERSVLLGVGHDDPAVTDPSRLRYDACLVIDEGTAVDDGIAIQVLPGGEHAVAVHRGPYELLPGAYAEIMGRWLPAQGRKLGRGSPYEIYRNNPLATAPQDLITEIRVPLA
jgi:AraC family transcriptional regulator